MMKPMEYTQDPDDSSVALSDRSEVHDDAVGHKAHEEQERKHLASRENQIVSYLRIVVYLVVLVTAVIVCVGVYLYMTNDEESDFESEFASYATKLIESFHDSVDSKIGAIATFSTSVTSYALSSGSSFPNVTIPDFEMLAANVRVQSGAVVLNWMPIVTDEEREGWEEYAYEARHWIMPSFMKDLGFKAEQDARYGITKAPTEAPNEVAETEPPQEEVQHTTTAEVEGDGYHKKIWSVKGDDEVMPEGSGPFMVLWQASPVLPIMGYLNLNLLSHLAIRDSMLAAMRSEKMVVGKAHDLHDPEDENQESEGLYNAYLATGQFRHHSSIYMGDPTADVVYPVFTDFGPNRTLAGILTSPIYWRMSLEGILPSKEVSAIVVMSNTQNQTFTYRVDGPEVTFLGIGDLHNTKFDDMVVSEDIMQSLIENAGPHNQGYQAAGLDTEYCSYSLRVYPSGEMEDHYLTNEPITLTLVVAAVFVFTSIVFIAYDLIVARRQRIVMKRAVESGALVSSLYPKEVRDRLFEDSKQPKKAAKSMAWQTASNPNKGDIETLGEAEEGTSKAIAEYYEHTTILFADLAGFTAWSSKRKPEEVFVLLETLYQAFDKIALKRKVYKIETVGDCYIAITGCPEAQLDHAVRMAKFAHDCQLKMSQLISNILVEKLGPSTASLSFRVGMHSGPITGGVLRGQKSRFQLFGDTINTASRMESNGVPNKIHVSQETADELIANGYGSWLTEREGGIEAKGKGRMRSYFVNVPQAKSIASKSSITMASGNSTAEDSRGDDKEEARFVAGNTNNFGSSSSGCSPVFSNDVEC